LASMKIFWAAVMSMGRVSWRLGKSPCAGGTSVQYRRSSSRALQARFGGDVASQRRPAPGAG